MTPPATCAALTPVRAALVALGISTGLWSHSDLDGLAAGVRIRGVPPRVIEPPSTWRFDGDGLEIVHCTFEPIHIPRARSQ